MFVTLPSDAREFKAWPWSRIEPYFNDLTNREITTASVEQWLADWTLILDLLDEAQWRLYADMCANTADESAQQAYDAFVDTIMPAQQAADQVLKEKLLATGLEPAGFEMPLRKMRSDADLFREANLPLLAEEKKLGSDYSRIVGAQSIEWEGQQQTLTRLAPILMEPDRVLRQRVWEQITARRLQDKHAITELWQKLLDVRQRIAINAGFDSFREYRWRQLYRFDYTPDDCLRFQDAIEEAVVPIATEIHQRRKERLGVDRLRPWDLAVNPNNKPPLHPFEDVEELSDKVSHIFHRLDHALGDYFDSMRRQNLFDLPNRPNKGPGAWCTMFCAAKVPYIMMNAVGTHNDIMTLAHESGHGFHAFEGFRLPYFQQRAESFVPIEFAEVASMAMEFLISPYLLESDGGFYSPEDAARARIEHLESSILFWPYMAVVDAFQHWAYQNPDDAADPENCDDKWTEIRRRFEPAIDYSGYEDVLANGWQEKMHIYEVPFYYVEYGLAMLGAVQVWRNSLADQQSALEKYRAALALAGARPLPELYTTADARLGFDADLLRECVSLMRDTIAQLEAQPA